ncbi:UNVERIFIED_CONTAM: hypothetical protein GTU68_028662 [Idotea baltica]|nr:hypothetical protein [Idotea baltica]
MLFSSIDFAIFLPIVFGLYWFAFKEDLKLQNTFVVLASYVFFGWWDWRFLSLIIFSTVVDYLIGIGVTNSKNQSKRRILLWISVGVNLGLLAFFKYFNFFLGNFIDAFSFFGTELDIRGFNIILPVGISFYTFQTLSYTIDVYRGKLKPTRDFIAFAAFVSFFPQLVAGPIERASHFLPQFKKKRIFDYSSAVDGLRQMLWGFFKKMVIADNCAEYANMMFSNPSDYNGMALALGALFFTFQIYGDFSGYSDIAIGTARLFGFDLRQNFAFPYFSRDIAEFWRRWHISLSSWFRDYLYIPLGGSRVGKWLSVRNVFIIFIVSGFWHGASWTFVFWGFLNALFFMPLLLTKTNRSNLSVVAENSVLPSFNESIRMLLTFSLVVIAWIFFRAENMEQAFYILEKIFSTSLFSIPDFIGRERAIVTIILIVFLLIVEWQGRRNLYGIEKYLFGQSRVIRRGFYFLLIFLILMFSRTEETPFIYFQF